MRQQLKRLENCTHRADSRLTVKSQLIAIVAAVLVVGCGPPSNPEADRALLDAAEKGNIEAVKLLLINNVADVNAKNTWIGTPLDIATHPENPIDTAETADLLRKHGGKTSEELKAEGK